MNVCRRFLIVRKDKMINVNDTKKIQQEYMKRF